MFATAPSENAVCVKIVKLQLFAILYICSCIVTFCTSTNYKNEFYNIVLSITSNRIRNCRHWEIELLTIVFLIKK